MAAAIAALCWLPVGAGRVERRYEPLTYEYPEFANWDCLGVRGILDWNEVYSVVVDGFRSDVGPVFALPEEVAQLLRADSTAAFEECPLGTVYFSVLRLYEMLGGGTAGTTEELTDASELLANRLAAFPFFVQAAARWPTYEALHHFSGQHRPRSQAAMERTLCKGVKGASGINWDDLLQAALAWSDEQLQGLEPGEGTTGNHGQMMKAAADVVYKDPASGSAAQDECPFGFLFLCTAQALAGGMRLTGAFEPWARAVDTMLGELPFFSVAGALWPTFQMLAMFSSLSKGAAVATLGNFQGDIHRWGSYHPVAKRFRQYGDLRLLPEELSPLGRREEGWKHVDGLVKLDPWEWCVLMMSQRMQNARPIYSSVLDAISQVVRASSAPARRECGHSGISEETCRSRGCDWKSDGEGAPSEPRCLLASAKRKVIGVTFVWGEQWAPLVPRFAAWASRIRLGVVIVAMGDACRRACQAAVAALGPSGGVACWDPMQYIGTGDPERGSILQRHALVHLLLHLGVDALAFDFDTFFFADPRPRLEEIAEGTGAEVLMTRHLDADCLNMGLLYLRASPRTAEWYHEYLRWLHQHPYEREQRGVNALLGFTGQKVSFAPKGMPRLKVVALDDHNEFASSRGGWLGDWGKILLFHWVNPAQTVSNWGSIKVSDISAFYHLALHQGADLLKTGNSLARAIHGAESRSLFGHIREILDTLRVDQPPPRQECW